VHARFIFFKQQLEKPQKPYKSIGFDGFLEGNRGEITGMRDIQMLN